MDTRVPNTPNTTQLGDDNKITASTSYAHAVLNIKQTLTTNKNDTAADVVQKNNIDERPKENVPINNNDDDDTFTPVINHNRKERKNEKHKKGKHKLVNGEKADNKHDKTEKQDKDKKETTNSNTTNDLNDGKKVFVEAPLPKVNPWQKNVGTDVSETVVVVEKKTKKDNATANGNGQVQSGVVKATKDKRRYNQKVR